MAVFSNLYHVGQVLATMIEEKHDPPLRSGTAEVGAPEDPGSRAGDAVRVTLLWTSPQPDHRNDSWERQPNGSRTPPPLTLSAYYLITCYSQSDVGAHEILGSVLRTFHSHPEIALPLASLPNNGEGSLAVIQVPLTPELVEKLFSPLQIKHTAFALFQVEPIQLEHLAPAREPGPLVKPGGVQLAGPDTSVRPLLSALVPDTASAGGRIRIDGSFASAPTVYIDGRVFAPRELVELSAGASYVLTLPSGVNAFRPGHYGVTVRVNDAISRRAVLTVAESGQPTLSAPLSATVSRLGSLVLQGTRLRGARTAYVWPATGISAPGEVIELPLSRASATRVTISDLSALAAGATYRLAIRIRNIYTPSITLEMTP
jgi:hypothetical protein